MKRKIKKIGIAILLLLAVTVGTLSTACPDTKDTLHVSSEKMVVKAATKKQKVAAYNKKAKKAYKKFLKSYFVQGKSFYCNGYEYKWSDKKNKNRKYTIRDINHDEKVELLVFNKDQSEHYLFTYYNNKVKCESVSGNEGAFFESKKGKVIVESSSHSAFEFYDLYILQKGTLKNVGSAMGQHEITESGEVKVNDIINNWHFYNGKKKLISKAKFKKILKKYTGSTDVKAFTAFNMQSKKVKTQLKKIKFKTYKVS